MKNVATKISDILFIGSGISTAFTILNFLEKLEDYKPTQRITIDILDKYPEYFKGIPYGKRSGKSVLLINSLQSFLPKDERVLFTNWLNDNKTSLLEEFKKAGGKLTSEWIENNKANIENNKWKKLFIPRFFFGEYIAQKTNSKLEKMAGLGYIKVNYHLGEALDIKKEKGISTVVLKNKLVLQSKKVVLGLGSLPSKKIHKNVPIVQEDSLLLINENYEPELSKSIALIKSFVENRKEKETNVVIIGANASGLELLYKMSDSATIKPKITYFTFLSTQGILPDSVIDYEGKSNFIPKNLNSLGQKQHLTAKSIAVETYKDLNSAEGLNLGAASTVDIISNAFGSLLSKLTHVELENFACKYGNEIGRRQRCAGIHYSTNVDRLKGINKLTHLAGRFSSLQQTDTGEYLINYTDTATHSVTTYPKAAHIVINCIGSTTFNSEQVPSLHQHLIDKKYCTPNKSKIGFSVNNNLEASSDLHIIGPLLAGNVINNKPVWHVEHCGRIIWLSKILAESLIDNLDLSLATHSLENEKSTFDAQPNYTLEVHKLANATDIANYKKLIENYWGNKVYYSYEYLKYYENETDKIRYFLLTKDGVPHVIMPFYIRKIKNTEDYKDVITPYGYGGPLCKDCNTTHVLPLFWKYVDNWYSENKIVSEFVRFNLNGNHKNYSGDLTETLLNVKGSIQADSNAQWNAFSGKVRNNYRKAQKNNLTFTLAEGNAITDEIISIFHSIYLETMERNNAKEIYFFTKQYFENIIYANPSNFAIALSYIDQTPVSTELIIIENETLFAFLGGTRAKYFECRPNDFLRVEILNWAIENHNKYYILGGGQSNNDGLYKSKKMFFPKDEDVIFYTGRKIINNEIYNELTEIAKTTEDNCNYFPAYRNL